MKYPGKNGYHFITTPSHTSPCMSPFFQSQEIRREGQKAEEHDRKMEEEEND